MTKPRNATGAFSFAFDVLEIGPDNAPEYLARMRVNRRPTSRRTNGFVRLIRQGRFRDHGTIHPDAEDWFYDGQHRLIKPWPTPTRSRGRT